jgi:hypothetical protein
MQSVDKIFGIYDNLIQGLPLGYQALISGALIFILFWNVYLFVRKGHWIFLMLLIVMLPGTWPAVMNICSIFTKIVLGLIVRIQGN